MPAWETSTFRAGKIFAMYSPPQDVKHSGGRPGVWLKAGPGNQEWMVRDRPDRFFVPPYVGPSGWIGVRLDRRVSWREVAELVEESWRLIAPKRAVAAYLDAKKRPTGPVQKTQAARAPKRRSRGSRD